MDWLPINMALARNPVNWIIVALMVALASMMLAVIVPPSEKAT